MTYWGSDKNNWSFDRGHRQKLFDRLKRTYNPSIDEDQAVGKKVELEPFPRKTKFDQIVPIIGAVLKLVVFLLIFYAMAMIISYGKYWPE
ncbi:MAG: hypothetical protein H6601_00290 [Flavobacteriales bacterium]|nr:hypothetical protein [Flavobacteriales bacterium]